jgi:hypothetical protein
VQGLADQASGLRGMKVEPPKPGLYNKLFGNATAPTQAEMNNTGQIRSLAEKLRAMEKQGKLNPQNKEAVIASLRGSVDPSLLEAIQGQRDYYGAAQPDADYLSKAFGLKPRQLTNEERWMFNRRRDNDTNYAFGLIPRKWIGSKPPKIGPMQVR